LFLDKSEPAYQDSDEYAEAVRERMQKAYRIVGDHLKTTFDRAKRRYDQRVREVRFKLNSYVWFYCPKLHAGRGRKFRKLTDGPYRIIRILNDVNYVIQKHPGSRPQICHVDRLLKYEGEAPRVWLKYDAEKRVQSTEQTLTEQNPLAANRIQDSNQLIRSNHSTKGGSTIAASQSGQPRPWAAKATSNQAQQAKKQQATGVTYSLMRCVRARPLSPIKAVTNRKTVIVNKIIELSTRKLIMSDKVKSQEFLPTDESDSDAEDSSTLPKVKSVVVSKDTPTPGKLEKLKKLCSATSEQKSSAKLQKTLGAAEGKSSAEMESAKQKTPVSKPRSSEGASGMSAAGTSTKSTNPIITFVDSDPEIESDELESSSKNQDSSRDGENLSTSMELSDVGSAKRTGPNIKHTKKKSRSSGSSDGVGQTECHSWTCKLCPGPTYSSVSGMRKHYWSHYHVWSAAQDTVREMTKEEREHQETLKGTIPIKAKKHPTASETGAKQIIPIPDWYRFPMQKPAASAAAGAPSSADEDDSMKPPKRIPMNRVDTPKKIEESTLAVAMDPTVRKSTKPAPVMTANRDVEKRHIIESPERPASTLRATQDEASPEIEDPSDDLELVEPELMKPEVVMIEDEDEDRKILATKTRPGVSKVPTLRTLRQLLLYGVPAVMREARRNCIYPMSVSEEIQLEQMYHTMLVMVPIVRELDSMAE
jgi:hypothetical protein